MEKAVSWKKILILAIAVCLFAGIIVKCNQFQKTPLASYKGQKYEKAVVTKIIKDNLAEDGSRYGTQKVLVKITTGTYKGKEISVMGGGMGMPSIGIYSHELYTLYGVENIIRIGSAGSYTEKAKLFDTVLATGAVSESNYARVQSGFTGNITLPSAALNEKLRASAAKQGIPLIEGNIHSSDVFYRQPSDEKPTYWEKLRDERGCLCVEMESFALFANAQVLGKNAACLLTISDSFVSPEITTAEQRQTSFTNMMKVALGAEY